MKEALEILDRDELLKNFCYLINNLKEIRSHKYVLKIWKEDDEMVEKAANFAALCWGTLMISSSRRA